MRVYHFVEDNPRPTWLMLASDLLDEKPIHTGEWQAMDTSGSPAHKTYELEDVSLVWDQVPGDPSHVLPAIDTAWAREHFAERVSGIPLNPAPSHVRWPYAVRGNADHTTTVGGMVQQFDHTYPERFWPRHAGEVWGLADPAPNIGIRFHYGDLNDVVSLLLRNPLTRQAYLPIWFPEDTGAGLAQDNEQTSYKLHEGRIRVPCTLGYHFMQRGNFLSCRYYLRSCDIYRHLSNDAYFAVALMRWVCAELKRRTEDREMKLSVRPGKLVIHIASLHAFTGDKDKIKGRIKLVSEYDR